MRILATGISVYIRFGCGCRMSFESDLLVALSQREAEGSEACRVTSQL